MSLHLNRLKGFLFAAIAAAAYGTNPAFAIPLYVSGMNPNSVLLFRYVIGIPILALIIWKRGFSFYIPRKALGSVATLGILMAFSSLTLFESYNYMNSGVASTLLFIYPVMVAVIMMFFFHERFRFSIILCLIVMLLGLWFLMGTSGSESLSFTGSLLVMISALTYAIYIVLVNVSKVIKSIPTTKLLFHVLGWGSLVFIVKIPMGTPLTMPSEPLNWINLVALAVIPTVLSLVMTTRAIQLIGSTSTAILGALEPVTAVVLSVVFLHQGLTLNEIVGGILIVMATSIVVCNNTVDHFLLHIRKMFPHHK